MLGDEDAGLWGLRVFGQSGLGFGVKGLGLYEGLGIRVLICWALGA